MSGLVAFWEGPMRAATAVNGPSSGYPATIASARVGAGRVENGDVPFGVIEHHARRERSPSGGDDLLLLGHAGHHVRIRDHVAGRVHEARSLDPVRAARRDPLDLHDAG